MRQLLRAWGIQRRVLGALLMREIQTRWGRRNLGFAWLFAEPLVFAFPVLVMWSLMRPPTEHGLPLMAFLWSGYLPLLLFRHTTSLGLFVVSQNAALLYHQRVTPFDIFIARCGLEALGNIAAIAFSFLVLYVLGVLDWPQNMPLFLIGNLYRAWWSLAVAMIIAAWSERSEIFEHVWQPVSYIYMPLSGFFYLAMWLPIPLRNLALAVMPSLHAYEMIRGGLLGARIEAFYDIGYLTFVLSGLTLFGLWLMRDVRRHMTIFT